MATDPPFRYNSLAKQVRQYIKQYIVDNACTGGDPLPPEGEIAQTLGVSRTAVREAVKALEALGIVEVRHGAGLFVRPFNLDATREILAFSLDSDAQTIAELSQARQWLDIGAMPEIVAQIDDAAIRELETILERWRAGMPEGDPKHEDACFHNALARVTGNRLLILLTDTYWHILSGSPELILHRPTDARANYEHHRRILDAVKARDVAAAQAAVAASYADQQQRARSVMPGRAAPPAPVAPERAMHGV